jgi:hypothetical protein
MSIELELAERGFERWVEGWVSVGYQKTLPDGRYVYITRDEEHMALMPTESDYCCIGFYDAHCNLRNVANVTGLRVAMDVADVLLASEPQWAA